MVTFIRTVVALPGKLFELLALAKEIAAVVKGVTGMDLTVCSAFGGNPTEVAWIWQFDSVAQLETNAVKVMADAEYRTVKEVGKLGCSGRGSRSDLDARLV